MVLAKSSWWSRRTSLEKRLTFITSICAVISIALLIAVIVVAVNSNNNEDSEDICLTKACIEESATVLAQMDQTHDPCDDFYEFACGTFSKETVIPDAKTSMTAFTVIDDQLKEQLRLIVQEPIETTEIEPFQNVKRLYRACLNTTIIEERGITPLVAISNDWPVVVGAAWTGNAWTWQQSVVNSYNNGYSVSYFMSFSVSTDNKDTSKRIIRIDQASLGLSREYLIQNMTEAFVVAYHDYQIDLALLFGAADRAAVEQEMRAVLDFEIELAMISLSREDRRDAEKLYNPMTVAQLQATYNYQGHNWLSYFNSILPTESTLTSEDIIIVGALEFFDRLGVLLESTSNRVLANYVAWRQSVASVNYLPNEFRQRQLEYDRLTSGREVAPARWLECVETTLGFYPHAFGALYVRKHFNADAKAKALEMVNNIREEFKEMLKEIEWMDEVTKAGANEKAETITEQIGFADELLNDTKLVEYYTLYPAVNEIQYYESIFNLNVASTLANYRRLREPVDKTEWSAHITPAIVNAFYSSLENSIKFPAGILQGAFFNAERPQYMNYGGIGFVIGHEITHGFDDQGSQYDSAGNLRNWWANSTRDAYLTKAKCIIDQYTNYLEPLTNLNLNGVNTQGENIADNGGIKESYRAYQRWAASNPEPSMPGLSQYTPQQMFWISAGQVWCGSYREEALKNRVMTGVHSPGQFRVIGPMSNMKEFADDFHCAAGTPMNPTSKCEVW